MCVATFQSAESGRCLRCWSALSRDSWAGYSKALVASRWSSVHSSIWMSPQVPWSDFQGSSLLSLLAGLVFGASLDKLARRERLLVNSRLLFGGRAFVIINDFPVLIHLHVTARSDVLTSVTSPTDKWTVCDSARTSGVIVRHCCRFYTDVCRRTLLVVRK